MSTTSLLEKPINYAQAHDDHDYDVVIMGAGFAGICQARHLALNIPNIKIALVDFRSEDRDVGDMKIGESMVEVAALFVCKELGLHEYMIENHTPKAGLNFHWPKQPSDTDQLDDYYHVWSNRQTAIASFHMNRAKFEKDVLAMTREMGVAFYNGRVKDVELTEGDTLNTVNVKQLNGECIELTAKHVVDAAGRKFLIGKKTDNVITEPENLYGLNTGSAWVRVKNIDRKLFDEGYNPDRATSSSYYATNHFFGQGHWLWMIPTDKESMELSIGIIHHHDVIPSKSINSKEKFYAFLKSNHKILSNIVESGEDIDFHYRRSIAYKSKEMFSPDNWYVLGDAAYIFDAFYSYGTTTIAFAVEGITEIIRAKLAGEADAETKRSAYNRFNLAYAENVNHLIRYHDKQLGHASVMSWRVYFEYMWWFGVHVPMYVGKWHLNLTFVNKFLKILPTNMKGLFVDVYDQFNQIVDRGGNIGLMDAYRADQLIGDYSPLNHFDHFLENAKLEPLRCNVFAGMKHAYFFIAIWYLKFQWMGFGIKGVLNPRHIYHFFRLLSLSVQAIIGEKIYQSKTTHLPKNTDMAEMRQEFTNYHYKPTWLSG